jgi:hypothetical protein
MVIPIPNFWKENDKNNKEEIIFFKENDKIINK